MTVPRSDATLRCLEAGATELVALAVARVSRVLTGLRRVVVVADNDNIGSKGASKTEARLHKTARRMRFQSEKITDGANSKKSP